MNKNQNDEYNMLLAVENHFDSNAPIWSLNIPVSDNKTAFSAKIDQIATAIALQMENSTGATKGKARLRTDLEEKGFAVSSALSAYANIVPGHDLLYKKAHITRAAFTAFRTNDLLASIDNLNEGAMTVIESLAPYGVTQATLTELMAARDDFRDAVSTPEEITETRKKATDSISTLLHGAISQLDNQMDHLMEVFRTTQPDFFAIYFNDRKIHHTGTRALSLEIYTRDANNFAPLAEAHLEVVGQNIKRISTEKGQNRIQNLKEGNYTLSVNRIGFVPQMIPFMIVSSQTTVIHVDMEQEVAKIQSSKVAEELS